MADIDRDENVLRATVYGDDMTGLKLDGLDQARRLFGPDAVLRIESVGRIITNIRTTLHPQEFAAEVVVRRVDVGEDWVRPLADPEANRG